ncbi:hypothetical protein TorRG33x02_310070, partial [Trema orientale]
DPTGGSPPSDGGVSHLNSSRTTSKNGTLGVEEGALDWQVDTLTFKIPKGTTQIRTCDLQPPG